MKNGKRQTNLLKHHANYDIHDRLSIYI